MREGIPLFPTYHKDTLKKKKQSENQLEMLTKLHHWIPRAPKEKKELKQEWKVGAEGIFTRGAFADARNVVLECNGLPKHRIQGLAQCENWDVCIKVKPLKDYSSKERQRSLFVGAKVQVEKKKKSSLKIITMSSLS